MTRPRCFRLAYYAGVDVRFRELLFPSVFSNTPAFSVSRVVYDLGCQLAGCESLRWIEVGRHVPASSHRDRVRVGSCFKIYPVDEL